MSWYEKAWVGVLGYALVACAAGGASEFQDDDDGVDGTGGAGGQGGSLSVSGSGGGMIDPPLDELSCSEVKQEVLIIDFRSGWWSGGGGGDFTYTALNPLVAACPGTTAEYHHFEVDFRIKCTADHEGTGGVCDTVQDDIALATIDEILTWFDKSSWDDYTQVWILSGSDLDAADVATTDAIFDHFLAETNGSCVPVLIGAGDGFVTHGNAVTTELGLGDVLSTNLPMPGFFSLMAESPPQWVSVQSQMTDLEDHILFSGITSLTDTVSNSGLGQTAQGDTVLGNPAYEIIARDSFGKPSIAVGSIDLPGDGDRPFVIDAGFQRFYTVGQDAQTTTFLQNLVQYLGLVGCKAEPPK